MTAKPKQNTNLGCCKTTCTVQWHRSERREKLLSPQAFFFLHSVVSEAHNCKSHQIKCPIRSHLQTTMLALSLLREWEYYTAQQTPKVHHIPVKPLIPLKHDGVNTYMCHTIHALLQMTLIGQQPRKLQEGLKNHASQHNFVTSRMCGW